MKGNGGCCARAASGRAAAAPARSVMNSRRLIIRSPRRQWPERLAMLGWVEGSNLRMDYRFADADPDRLAAYAEELVNLRPDLIIR
jgi:hypothetical protein